MVSRLLRDSPFVNIPNELLTIIFTQGTKSWRVNDVHNLPFPLLVASVCKRWRHVAHTLPELWNVIIPPLHLLNKAEFVREWVDPWFERSKSLPLSIIIDDRLWTKHHKWAVIWEAAVLSTLQSMEGRVQRVERLDIVLESYDGQFAKVVETLISISEGDKSFESLLQLSSVQRHWQHSIRFANWISTLPQIRHLRWSGTLPQSLNQLVAISLRDLRCTTEAALIFFRACPQIEIIVLFAAHFDMKETMRLRLQNASPFKLTNLKQLAIRPINRSMHHPSISTYESVPYPFGFCEMPNLEYLELDMSFSLKEAFGASLFASPLQTLRISNSRSTFNHNTQDRDFLRSIASKCHTLEAIRFPAKDLFFAWQPTESSSLPTGRQECQSNEGNIVRCPHLKSITFFTQKAEDVSHFRKFVSFNAGIEEISINSSVRDHLAEIEGITFHVSSAMWNLNKNQEGGSVKLRTITSSFGLLDGEKRPPVGDFRR